MSEGECKLLFHYIICSVLFFLSHMVGQNFPEGIIKLSCTCIEVVVASLLISHDKCYQFAQISLTIVVRSFFVVCLGNSVSSVKITTLFQCHQWRTHYCDSASLSLRSHRRTIFFKFDLLSFQYTPVFLFNGVKSQHPSDVRC